MLAIIPPPLLAIAHGVPAVIWVIDNGAVLASRPDNPSHLAARSHVHGVRGLTLIAVGDDDVRNQMRKQAMTMFATLFVRSFVGKVIVWSAFLLFVALLFIAFGWLSAGTAADWAAAGGAIFAAAVALNIAGKDRAERREERQTAGLAQMRLVEINPREWDDSSAPDVNLKVVIANYGQRPILRALLVSAEVESVSAGTFKMADPTPVRVLSIVPTVRQPALPGDQTLNAAMKNAGGDPWRPRRYEAHRAKFANGLIVKIQCTDADGEFWLLSNEDDPQRNVPAPGPPVWQRFWTHRIEVLTTLRVLLAPSYHTRIALIASAIVAVMLVLVWINWHWLSCAFWALLG